MKIAPAIFLCGGLCLIIAFALPILLHNNGQNDIAAWLVEEDGPYETAGALFSLVAGIIFIVAFWKFPLKDGRGRKKRRNIFLLLFGLFLLFLFAEEISWGQRLFGIEVPDKLAAMSYQGELNLHNIKIMQSSNNAISTYGAKLLLLYLVVPPLLFLVVPRFGSWLTAKGIPFTSLSISILAILNYILLKVAVAVFGAENETIYSYRITEIYEVNLELLLFLFALVTVHDLRTRTRANMEVFKGPFKGRPLNY